MNWVSLERGGPLYNIMCVCVCVEREWLPPSALASSVWGVRQGEIPLHSILLKHVA